MKERDEDALIDAALAGSTRAFGALVDRHQSAVRSFLRRLTGQSADADDIAQEAFVRAFGLLASFKRRSSFRTFVCGIAYRVWRGHYRASKRGRLRDGAYLETAMIERPRTMDVDLYLSLRQAMDALPHEQRAVLALCLGAEFSHSEAADALGIPIGTVKSHVTRGRMRLRQVLGVDAEQAEGGRSDE